MLKLSCDEFMTSFGSRHTAQIMGPYFPGRPDLTFGRLFTQATKALSLELVNRLKPQRNSSLFLIDSPSAKARPFKAANWSYSALGKVKLSRTTLGFLGLAASASSVGFVTTDPTFSVIPLAIGFITDGTVGLAGRATFLSGDGTLATSDEAAALGWR
jgi:hypothetical protein